MRVYLTSLSEFKPGMRISHDSWHGTITALIHSNDGYHIEYDVTYNSLLTHRQRYSWQAFGDATGWFVLDKEKRKKTGFGEFITRIEGVQ